MTLVVDREGGALRSVKTHGSGLMDNLRHIYTVPGFRYGEFMLSLCSRTEYVFSSERPLGRN